MRTDWERLRESMLRPEINKIVAKENHSAQDACDLKVLLKCMEMSRTCQMFDEQNEGSYAERNYAYRDSYGPVRNYHMFNEGYDRHGRGDAYYDNGVSGHTETELLKHQLETMLHSAQEPKVKQAIQEAINHMK